MHVCLWNRNHGTFGYPGGWWFFCIPSRELCRKSGASQAGRSTLEYVLRKAATIARARVVLDVFFGNFHGALGNKRTRFTAMLLKHRVLQVWQSRIKSRAHHKEQKKYRMIVLNGGISLIPYAPWCWYIFLQNWVILFGQMMVNIPAPWSIWACSITNTLWLWLT